MSNEAEQYKIIFAGGQSITVTLYPYETVSQACRNAGKSQDDMRDMRAL